MHKRNVLARQPVLTAATFVSCLAGVSASHVREHEHAKFAPQSTQTMMQQLAVSALRPEGGKGLLRRHWHCGVCRALPWKKEQLA
eukprot:11409574-Karenia_brevis.AAC.1